MTILIQESGKAPSDDDCMWDNRRTSSRCIFGIWQNPKTGTGATYCFRDCLFSTASACSTVNFYIIVIMGRLSPAGLGAFLTGVLLWKKLFCGILTLGEKDEKEKQTSRVRKK